MILRRALHLFDGTLPLKEKGLPRRHKDKTPAGRHEIQQIPSPHNDGRDWYVLKGTKIGDRVDTLESFRPGQICQTIGHPKFGTEIDYGAFTIVILKEEPSAPSAT